MDARSQRFEAKDLPRLMKGAKSVLVAKGSRSKLFKPGNDPALWKEIAEVAIGPTGNLRAPTLRRGATMRLMKSRSVNIPSSFSGLADTTSA